jgi:hypothetical protein
MKRRTKNLILVLGICGMSFGLGCCATTSVWDSAGSYTEAQFQQDWAQCKYEVELNMHPSSYRNTGEAIGAGIVDGLREKELVHRCMEAKGWHMVPAR